MRSRWWIPLASLMVMPLVSCKTEFSNLLTKNNCGRAAVSLASAPLPSCENPANYSFLARDFSPDFAEGAEPSADRYEEELVVSGESYPVLMDRIYFSSANHPNRYRNVEFQVSLQGREGEVSAESDKSLSDAFAKASEICKSKQGK